MEIEKIHCENWSDNSLRNTYEGRLREALNEKVFHLTSQRAFNLIQESGGIEHNKAERCKLNTGSENSFGRQKGWVCFFDLRNASPELIIDILERYDFLYPPGDFSRKSREDWMEYSLAYLILDSKYYDRLIPYEKFNQHVRNTEQFPMAVPKVETWVADRVPITWIERVILTRIGRQRTAHEIQISQVHDNLFRRR